MLFVPSPPAERTRVSPRRAVYDWRSGRLGTLPMGMARAKGVGASSAPPQPLPSVYVFLAGAPSQCQACTTVLSNQDHKLKAL